MRVRCGPGPAVHCSVARATEPRLAGDTMRLGVWDPHENPGRRSNDRASGLGCGIRTKTPGAVPMTEQAVLGVGSARKPWAPTQNRSFACFRDTNCFQIHTDNGGAKKIPKLQGMCLQDAGTPTSQCVHNCPE